MGAESFQLSAARSVLSVRGGPAPAPDAVITLASAALYALMSGGTYAADTARQATVTGDPETARVPSSP